MKTIAQRVIVCDLCQYQRVLRHDEDPPKRCPACGDGRWGWWKMKRPIKNSM